MTYREIFKSWFKTFNYTNYRQLMGKTIENSPHHREDNVWVHTQMVMNQFYTQTGERNWSKEDFMTAIAIAFHDTGKPYTEEINYRDDGSEYRSYKNHEYYSAGIFMDYILSNTNDSNIIANHLSDDDIYNIWVMIAYHLPYQFNDERRRILKTHLENYGLVETFTRFIISDCYGRISDDEKHRNERCHGFIDDFVNLDTVERHDVSECNKKIIMIAGVTGCGKTSLIHRVTAEHEHYDCHSMDALRLEWYSNDYTEAFKMSSEDKSFNNSVARDFFNKLKYGTGILVVDNTHIGYKQRKKYLRNRDTYHEAYVKFISHERNVKQNNRREDKYIPSNVVTRMYYSFQPILLGEVDDLNIILEKD